MKNLVQNPFSKQIRFGNLLFSLLLFFACLSGQEAQAQINVSGAIDGTQSDQGINTLFTSNFMIADGGAGTLTVDGITSSNTNFTVTWNTGDLGFSVSTTPTAIGVTSTEITISFTNTIMVPRDPNDPASALVPFDTPDTKTFTINVRGTAPQIAVNLAGHNGTYDFGNITFGSNSGDIFTVSNSGNIDLNLTNISIAGDDADDFELINNTTSPVAGGGNTGFSVKFTPSSLGEKTATLSIVSDDPNTPTYTINLRGTGVGLPQINVYEHNCATGEFKESKRFIEAETADEITERKRMAEQIAANSKQQQPQPPLEKPNFAAAGAALL